MMLCSRCHKRPAVVFISPTNGSEAPQGLCLSCAKELGIKPVNDILDKMGLTDEQLDSMESELGQLMNPDGEEDESDPNETSAFTPGGAATFPSSFLQNIFPNMGKNGQQEAEQGQAEQTQKGKRLKQKTKRRHLNAYCTNLTAKAAAGEIDAVIGRERELNRVVQILSRRTKNNPCLIGEPGVGKTAIAEGLAMRIAAGSVPARLQKKEIHLLDLTALVAGTQFRGQFESRIKGLVDEVKAEGNIILFIDEVHNLVGTGDAEGSMNAANILKPALSRGEIQVIGATTFVEYRKYIEKDAALERRFQPVTVAEPTLAEARDILSGVRTYYEQFHRVHVPDEIVSAAVRLSERYITDRFLPDKAIDLLDESCAHAALRTKMVQLEEKEKTLAPQALGANVEMEDLAQVIELWTGIPASRIQESELRKLSGLEETLNRHIIGQKEAVAAVTAAVRRSRVQISPRRRPASFIFVGPTGVGKTELVKVLSQELFDTPETLIRLDMSEFMEKHSVSRIIGSPPGYVGYDEAGQLTEKVRRRPYSVLLFDEIEKAHPDVLNILLQILDEGRVTDAHGRTVNFENTILVMTSNAGSERRENALGFGKTQEDASRERAQKALSEFLRPEFLARVDEVVVFRPLDAQDFRKIAALMLDEYKGSLAERHIKLEYDEKATAWLADHAIGGRSGARDLRNLIRREVEDKLAEALIDRCDTMPAGLFVTAGEKGVEIQILP